MVAFTIWVILKQFLYSITGYQNEEKSNRLHASTSIQKPFQEQSHTRIGMGTSCIISVLGPRAGALPAMIYT